MHGEGWWCNKTTRTRYGNRAIPQSCNLDKKGSLVLPCLSACTGRWPWNHPCGRQRQWPETLSHMCPYLKSRRSTPAPGRRLLRSWWLHLGLGRGRTDSTGAALGVPRAWTAERRRWEQMVGHSFFPSKGGPNIGSVHVYICHRLCLNYKINTHLMNKLGEI